MKIAKKTNNKSDENSSFNFECLYWLQKFITSQTYNDKSRGDLQKGRKFSMTSR